MRRLAAAGLCLTLLACSEPENFGGRSADFPPRVSYDSDGAPSEQDAIQAFRLFVAMEGFPSNSLSDSEVVDLAESWCEIFAATSTQEELGGVIRHWVDDEGFELDFVTAVAAASVNGWCPSEGERLGLS